MYTQRGCKKSFIATHLISGRNPRASDLEGFELHDALRVHLETRLQGEFHGVKAEFGAGSNSTDKVIYRKDMSDFERIVLPTLEMEEDQRGEVSFCCLVTKGN